MKKQNFTNTILYTHNTLVPITKQNLALSNQFGAFLKNNYKYDIIWVPVTPNGDTRQIRIMPQYKFGHSDDPNSSFIDALSSSVNHNVSSQLSSTTINLNAIPDKTNYTDNIVLKLNSSVVNNTLNINSSLSNYSSFLANIAHNIPYNMAFRLMISIYNVTTNTTEHTVYSYTTNVRFGRSPIQKPGPTPDLLWDKKPNGDRYPPISIEPDPVILFEGQNYIPCNCLGANQSLLISANLSAIFDGKTFVLDNSSFNQIYGPYSLGGDLEEFWRYDFSQFGEFGFEYRKYVAGNYTDYRVSKFVIITPNFSTCKWTVYSTIDITDGVFFSENYYGKRANGEFRCKDGCLNWKISNNYTSQDVIGLPFGSPVNMVVPEGYPYQGADWTGGSPDVPFISIGSQNCN